ncbi:MAG: alpha/beta hydrolase [Kofleriaceae bacterium]
MKSAAILVCLVVSGCGAGPSAETDDDADDVVPPDSPPPSYIHDPGLEGPAFALTDPACTEAADQISCSAVIYSEVNGVQLHLDIHAPLEAKSARVPTIMYLHPGGWSVGSYHQIGQLRLADSLARGYAVVSVEYRLTLNEDRSPSGVTFPENLIDAKTAVRWLRLKGSAFVDPDRIVAYGTSSGAHLAALVAVTPDVAAFAGRGDPSVATTVKAAVAISAPIDFHLFVPTNPPLADTCPSQPAGQDPQAAVSLLAGVAAITDVTEAQLASLSPVTYFDATTPPIQFFAGTCDQTVPYTGADVTARQRAAELELSQIQIFVAPDAFHGTTLDTPQAQATLATFLTGQLD